VAAGFTDWSMYLSLDLEGTYLTTQLFISSARYQKKGRSFFPVHLEVVLLT